MASSASDDVEVIIVGAGAAGLAAGARLAASKISFAILEARDRVGGRAFTRRDLAYPLDLGCGWLHSADRNPWTRLAKAAGFAIDRTIPAWTTQALDLGFSAEDQMDFQKAAQRFYERLQAVDAKAADFPAVELLEADCRWNKLIDAESCYMNGAELERVSAHDLSRYADTGVNWRVREGYGAAIATHAAGLPIVLDCAVNVIDHQGKRLRVETTRGVFTSDALIMTAPTPLIASRTIRFRPDLPEKASAAASLPLGLADKLVMSIDAPDALPVDGHLFGNPKETATGSYHLRPFGRPLIEGYFGGGLASELEAGGPAAFYAFAASELANLFGGEIRTRLSPVSATSWGLDPYARGSYSYARPGYADARALLAAPVDNRLFFAGEACSQRDFTTAHGAYWTGVEAAEQTIACRHGEARAARADCAP